MRLGGRIASGGAALTGAEWTTGAGATGLALTALCFAAGVVAKARPPTPKPIASKSEKTVAKI
jgi:hypothetical protein